MFSGLGDEYRTALHQLRKNGPDCLEDALEVTLEDGSHRFTTARDTDTDNKPFPDCVRGQTEVITAAFDRVDKMVAEILRSRFGGKLDVVVQGRNGSRRWEGMDSKTHLHVYKHNQEPSLSPLALPYHTDNGLYVLLTPSSTQPLRALSKNGTVHLLDTGDDSVVMLLGTGLTQWLLPSSSLHAPSHGLPSLSSSLHSTSRTVMARMTVAPGLSLPSSSPSSPTFSSHFSSPLGKEKGRTLARLRKARSAGCSQDWPHACTHGCDLSGVYLTWYKGEPIQQFYNVRSTGECKYRCRENQECEGWTLNTNNGWCALKKSSQIKPVINPGFESGIKNAGSDHCNFLSSREKRETDMESVLGSCSV